MVCIFLPCICVCMYIYIYIYIYICFIFILSLDVLGIFTFLHFYTFKKFVFNSVCTFLLLSCFSTHIHLLQFFSESDRNCLHGVSLRFVAPPHEASKLAFFQMYLLGANSFCMYDSAIDIILIFRITERG